MLSLPRLRLFAWILFCLWWIGIFLLSSIPGDKQPPTFEIPHLDKAVHFLLFLFGGAALSVALHTSFPQIPHPFLLVIVILIMAGIGALDEWYQTFTPGRSGASLPDWIADIAGATTAALCSTHVLRKRFGSRPTHSTTAGGDRAP